LSNRHQEVVRPSGNKEGIEKDRECSGLFQSNFCLKAGSDIFPRGEGSGVFLNNLYKSRRRVQTKRQPPWAGLRNHGFYTNTHKVEIKRSHPLKVSGKTIKQKRGHVLTGRPVGSTRSFYRRQGKRGQSRALIVWQPQAPNAKHREQQKEKITTSRKKRYGRKKDLFRGGVQRLVLGGNEPERMK